MSVTGADAHMALLEAIRDIRREEDELLNRLAHGAALVGALKIHESELFRQVAAMRLESDARSALSSDLLGRERNVSLAIAALEERLTPAVELVTDLDRTIASLFERRNAAQRDMLRQQRELAALARRAGPALAENPQYLAAQAAATRAAEIAQATRRKSEEALARHAVREQHFRRDPLFTYLSERGFDTRAYRGNAVSAWFDGFVARVISYRQARQVFQLANELPLAWHDLTQSHGEKAREAATRRDELESIAVDSIGGKAVRDGLQASLATFADLERQIITAEDRRDDALRAWRDTAQASALPYTTALESLSTALNRAELWAMLAEARETPKGRDIAAVQQIDELRERIRDEIEEAREQRAQLRTLALRRRDLEDIAYEMRAQRLDATSSRFDNDGLVSTALNAFLRGEMSASAYWEQWRSAHVFLEDPPQSTLRASLSRPRGSSRLDATVPAA